MKEDIIYTNRDKDKLHIEFPEKGKCLITKFSDLPIGMSQKSDGTIESIDPSGGPFLFIGFDLNDLIYRSLEEFLDDPIRREITKLELTKRGIEVDYKEVDKFKTKKK